jgi:hypothetical protein
VNLFARQTLQRKPVPFRTVVNRAKRAPKLKPELKPNHLDRRICLQELFQKLIIDACPFASVGSGRTRRTTHDRPRLSQLLFFHYFRLTFFRSFFFARFFAENIALALMYSRLTPVFSSGISPPAVSKTRASTGARDGWRPFVSFLILVVFISAPPQALGHASSPFAPQSKVGGATRNLWKKAVAYLSRKYLSGARNG